MLVIAQQTIPRGGTLTVDPVGDGETMSFRVTASRPERPHAAEHRRPPERESDGLGVDAHAVQPYYTRLLAQACGLNVTLAPEGEAVVVDRVLKRALSRAIMVNQRFTSARPDSWTPSYLFVEPVLFHLLNQY